MITLSRQFGYSSNLCSDWRVSHTSHIAHIFAYVSVNICGEWKLSAWLSKVKLTYIQIRNYVSTDMSYSVSCQCISVYSAWVRRDIGWQFWTALLKPFVLFIGNYFLFWPLIRRREFNIGTTFNGAIRC